jgi:NADH-quinone oxidoreductase subunit H
VLIPVIVAGSMNLNAVANQQTGFFWNWYVFRDPFTFAAFWTYFTCATASCKRAPFDLAEAESELVAGFHTEYSGFRWLSLFMAEYGSMFAVSGIAGILFLGGWNTGVLPDELTVLLGGTDTFLGVVGNIINVLVFIGKCWLLVFVMMWVRWTLPRLRIDQVMMTCLKYLLPISCVLLVGISLWQLAMPKVVLDYLKYPLAVLCVGGLALMIYRAATMTTLPPMGGMVGAWGPLGAPKYGEVKQ